MRRTTTTIHEFENKFLELGFSLPFLVHLSCHFIDGLLTYWLTPLVYFISMIIEAFKDF